MKKLIIFLTVTALIFSLLCGCTSQAESTVQESPAAESAQVSQETASEAAESVPSEEILEDADIPLEDAEGMMNPQNMGVAYNYPLGTGQTISIFNSLHTSLSDITEYSQYPFMEYVTEQTGYEMEWTSVDQGVYSEKINLLLASGEYTDLIMNFTDASTTLASAYEDEIIVDLTDYLPEYSPNYYALLTAQGNEDFLRDAADDDGRMLCYWMLQNSSLITEGYWVRTDMLETVGISEIPTTIDGWETAMLAVKDSGAYPDFKTGLLINSESFSQYFSYAYDIPATRATMGLYHIEDVVHSCYTEDAFRDYITMMRNWYAKGILFSDFVSMDSNPMSAEVTSMITNDQALVYSGWNSSAASYKANAANPDFAVAGIPEPMLEEGVMGHFANANRLNNMHNLVITTSADSVEDCVQFCDWWYTGKGIDLYNYGIEGEVWNWSDDGSTREYTDLVMNSDDGYEPSTAWSRYTLYGNFIGYSNEWRSTWSYSGEELEAMETWNAAMDNTYTMPFSFMSLTTAETEKVATPMSDIDTYVSEHLAMFVIGEENIDDDAVWSEFVSTVEGLGLETVVSTYQDAFNRYMAR